MALDPRAIKFHTLGNTMAQEQKYNEAIVNYQKAIEIEPGYSAAYYHLAEVYEEKKVENDALEAYKKAIELNPSYATQHIDTGLDTLLSGPLGQAVADYKKNVLGKSDDDENLDPGVQDASTVASPTEGSPVDMATRPAIDKPRGQAGLTPIKLLINPAAENISSRVWSYDSVTATVLGDKDIPVAQAPVTFKLSCDPGLEDAFMAITAERASAEDGPDTLKLKTDGEGKARVFFRRSKKTGMNRIEVSVEGLEPQVFEDNTHAADIARAEISPREPQYQTAQEVEFSADAFDSFENPVAGVELALSLQMKTDIEWEVVDNDNVRTDADGHLSRVFRMPTRGHTRCRFEVACKTSGFSDNIEFNVVPGKANYAMFIPSDTTVAPGQQFAVKMRLLDEYDNSIDGVRAAIILEEASGGEWTLGGLSSETTGMDGGITLSVTAPDTPGATAVFAPQSDYLPENLTARSRIETADQETAPTSEQVVYDEFGGEFDGVEDETPPAPDSPPLDIELGEDSLAGLPDIPGDEPAATQPYNETEPAASGGFEPEPGAAHGLDSLDYDSAGPMPAAGDAAPPAGDLTTPQQPPATDPAAEGGTLDMLGSMLDEEQPGTDAEPPPAGDLTAPPGDFSAQDTDFSPEDSLVLPDDVPADAPMQEEGPQQAAPEEPPYAEPGGAGDEYIYEETHEQPGGYEEPAGTTAPSPAPPGAADSRGGDIQLLKEDSELSCRAGETVPVKITAKNLDGSPSSDPVRFELIEDIGPGADAVMLGPGGRESGRAVDVDPDLSGEAAANVKTSGACGSFNVSISSAAAAESITINVAPGAPEAIEIIAPRLDLTPGETIDIAARITDSFDNPIPGEFVVISIDEYTGSPGALGEQPQQQSDSNGQVIAAYTASESIGDSVTITASNPNVGEFSIKKAVFTIVPADEAPAMAAAAPAGDYETEYAQPAPYEEYAADDYADTYTEPAPEYEPEYADPGYEEESYTEPAPAADGDDFFSAPGGIDDPAAFLAGQKAGGGEEASAPPPPAPAGELPEEDFSAAGDYPSGDAYQEPPPMPVDDFAPDPGAEPAPPATDDFIPPMPGEPGSPQPDQDFQQPEPPPPMPGGGDGYQPPQDVYQEGAPMDDQTIAPGEEYAAAGTVDEVYEDAYDDGDGAYMEDDEENPYAIPSFEIEVGKKSMVEIEQLMPKLLKIGGLVAGLLIIGIVFLLTHKIIIYEWYYSQAMKYEVGGDYSKALEAGRKAHETDPERPEVLNRMANIHIQNSERALKRNDIQTAEIELNQALDYLEKQLKLEPASIDALFSYGTAFEQKQEYCNALEQFERILEHDPSYQAAEAKRNVLREKCRLMKGVKDKRGRGRRDR